MIRPYFPPEPQKNWSKYWKYRMANVWKPKFAICIPLGSKSFMQNSSSAWLRSRRIIGGCDEWTRYVNLKIGSHVPPSFLSLLLLLRCVCVCYSQAAIFSSKHCIDAWNFLPQVLLCKMKTISAAGFSKPALCYSYVLSMVQLGPYMHKVRGPLPIPLSLNPI